MSETIGSDSFDKLRSNGARGVAYGAREARLIIASMRRVEDAEKVLRHAPGVPVVSRVFEDAEANRIEQLGGIPILNSHAAADTFMEWFAK